MTKPIFGMLHLGGDTRAERLARAQREARVMAAGGLDGVIVENYFGDIDDILASLDWVCQAGLGVQIGLNVLDDDARAFELASAYPVDFVQLDGVAGHLPPERDGAFAAQLAQWRSGVSARVLGGVRFKYQPILSGRPEAEDIRIGAARCDGLVVTGDATGAETDLAKVARFRAVVGAGYPLLIGAGLTAANAAEQLAVADGAIVGSYLKDTYEAKGEVSADHVRELVRAAQSTK
ncbi:MAG: hypothetical protein LBR58_01730 [Propionibacteriaceae bacterium]|jgi:predicted TIM-barrel enzyme|nr:hypothetical protein [Propionibacteriaceae bacterium]